jgi:glycosyltransferase involved in cell wall biosynthesis
MRVLFVSRCPPAPLFLGDRLILHHLARELYQRGHTLDLLAFDDRPDLPDAQAEYAGLFAHVSVLPASTRTPAGLLRRIADRRARFPASAQAAWSPAMWQAIRARMTAVRYDLAHFFGGVQVYEFARALDGLPALITPYESFSLLLERQYTAAPGPRLWLERQAARACEAFMYTPFRRVVVVAAPDRDALLRLNPALPVEVIPNGIDLARWPPPDPAAPRVPGRLLFTGNFEYGPNVDAARVLVTELLPHIRAACPHVHVRLAGVAAARALADVAALPGVSVAGEVPEMRAELLQAEVYIAPLRLGAGIKNKVLEAMAAGCPVAGTPISLDGIAAPDGEVALVRPLAGLVQAAVLLLQDAALRQRLAAQARALIETRYSWAVVAEAYQSLYRSVTISA